jgi:hypothetical protein
VLKTIVNERKTCSNVGRNQKERNRKRGSLVITPKKFLPLNIVNTPSSLQIYNTQTPTHLCSHIQLKPVRLSTSTPIPAPLRRSTRVVPPNTAPGVKTPPFLSRPPPPIPQMAGRSSNNVAATARKILGVATYPGSGPLTLHTTLHGVTQVESVNPLPLKTILKDVSASC